MQRVVMELFLALGVVAGCVYEELDETAMDEAELTEPENTGSQDDVMIMIGGGWWHDRGIEDCYDLWSTSCRKMSVLPACPSADPEGWPCSSPSCWVVRSSRYVQEYQCW